MTFNDNFLACNRDAIRLNSAQCFYGTRHVAFDSSQRPNNLLPGKVCWDILQLQWLSPRVQNGWVCLYEVACGLKFESFCQSEPFRVVK